LGARPGSSPIRARIGQWIQGTYIGKCQQEFRLGKGNRRDSTSKSRGGNGGYSSSSCAARNSAASGGAAAETRQFRDPPSTRRGAASAGSWILQRIPQQLSPFDNRNNDRSNSENLNENAVNELGYKLKLDNFDGTAPLREFFSQFELIARANRWNDEVKTIALESYLRGKARAVLECIVDIESLNYAELKAKLELRFDEAYLVQSYYSLFTNRKQKSEEDEATLNSDIERFSQLAYPECSHQVREKIACAQFISALSNKFVRRTLQLEGVTSLKIAIQRAMTVKVILDNNSEREKDYKDYNRRNFEGKNNNFRGRKYDSEKEKNVVNKNKEN